MKSKRNVLKHYNKGIVLGVVTAIFAGLMAFGASSQPGYHGAVIGSPLTVSSPKVFTESYTGTGIPVTYSLVDVSDSVPNPSSTFITGMTPVSLLGIISPSSSDPLGFEYTQPFGYTGPSFVENVNFDITDFIDSVTVTVNVQINVNVPVVTAPTSVTVAVAPIIATGDTVPVTITLNSPAIIPFTAPVTVSANLALYTDAAGTVPLFPTAVAFAPGSATPVTPVYVKGLLNGSAFVTVTPSPSSGVASGTIPTAVVSGTPATVTVSTVPVVPICGQTAFISATVKDAAGQNVVDGTSILFNDGGAGGLFTPVSGATVTAGGIGNIQYVHPSGDNNVEITAAAGSAIGNINVSCTEPAPVIAALLPSTPTTVVAGERFVYTIEFRDALNVPTPLNTNIDIELTEIAPAIGVNFYPVGGLTPVGDITASAGQTQVQFEISGLTAGNTQIQVRAEGYADLIGDVMIIASAPAKIVIDPVIITVPAGTRAAANARLFDSYNNPALFPVVTPAQLVSNSGTGVFSNSPSGPAITSLLFPVNTTSVPFYYGNNVAGTDVIQANIPGLIAVPGNINVEAGAPAQLGFIPYVPTTAPAGTASAPFAVGIFDIYGNTATAGTNINLNFLTNSTSPSAIFKIAGSPVTGATIPSGSSQTLPLSYQNNVAGTDQITIRSEGYADLIGDIQIIAGTPSKAVVTPASQAITAGSIGNIQIGLQDAFGNPANALFPVNITYNSNVPGATFVPGNILIPTGSNISAPIAYANNTAGTHVITPASSTPGIINYVPGNIVVNPAAGTRLSYFPTFPLTTPAGTATSPFIVMLLDPYDNIATAGTNINLNFITSSSSPSALFKIGGSPVTGATIPSGASQTPAITYQNTVAGIDQITTRSEGYADLIGDVMIIAGAPSKVVIDPVIVTTPAGTRIGVNARLYDANNNPAYFPIITPAQLVSNSGTGVFSTTPSGPLITSINFPATATLVPLYYGNSVAGTDTINATIPGLTSVPGTVNILAGAPVKILIDPATATTPAGTRIGVNARLYDANNNPAYFPIITPAQLVSNSGTGVFSTTPSGPLITSINFPATATLVPLYYGNSVAGTDTINATIPGLTSVPGNITITGGGHGAACTTGQIAIDFREITYFNNQNVITSSDAGIRTANGISGAFNPTLWPYPSQTDSRGTQFRVYGVKSGAVVTDAATAAVIPVVYDSAVNLYYANLGSPRKVNINISDIQTGLLKGNVQNDNLPGSVKLTAAQQNVPGILVAHNIDTFQVPQHMRATLTNGKNKGVFNYINVQLYGNGAGRYKEFVDVEVNTCGNTLHTLKRENFEGNVQSGCNYLDRVAGRDGLRLNDLFRQKNSSAACGTLEDNDNQKVRANYAVSVNAVQLLPSVNTADDTAFILYGNAVSTSN